MMTVGQIVDFCKTYNEMNAMAESDTESDSNKKTGTTRKATQADWDRFARS